MTKNKKKIMGISIGVLLGAIILFFIFKGTETGGHISGKQILTDHDNKKTEEVSDRNDVYADEKVKKKELLSDEDIEKDQEELKETISAGKTTGSELSPTKKDGSLKFPYVIPGTKLEIQKYESYSGYFLEDGSNDEVKNIPVILLKNRSDVGIEYAHITMKQGNTELVFDITALPAGGIIVAQEKNRMKFQEGGVTDCTATVAEREEFETIREQIQITENNDNSITVTNLTGVDIPCVRVFYKLYMSEEKAFIGGICFNAMITNLAANSSQTVIPAHYASGSSKVVMVRTYETVED